MILAIKFWVKVDYCFTIMSYDVVSSNLDQGKVYNII